LLFRRGRAAFAYKPVRRHRPAAAIARFRRRVLPLMPWANRGKSERVDGIAALTHSPSTVTIRCV
jgi:hypothetical protein